MIDGEDFGGDDLEDFGGPDLPALELERPFARDKQSEAIESIAQDAEDEGRHLEASIIRSELRYRVVVADPPWRFADKLPGTGRGAHRHYDVMRAEDICRLVLPPIADDAHLFMWRVSSMQQEALDVVRSWGFTVKSELVWIKRTSGGAVHFGMGRHVRMSHEVCLIATRGRGAGILNRSQRSIFEHLDDDAGGHFDAEVGAHSAKPEAFYEIVRALVPGPRLELFARVARPGFDAIGNQLADNPTTLVVGA